VLAATPPDLGAPDFAAFCSTGGAFLGAAIGYATARSPRTIERLAFRGGFLGCGAGFLFYGFGLVTGLY
jgi:hypothetical protein